MIYHRDAAANQIVHLPRRVLCAQNSIETRSAAAFAYLLLRRCELDAATRRRPPLNSAKLAGAPHV